MSAAGSKKRSWKHPLREFRNLFQRDRGQEEPTPVDEALTTAQANQAQLQLQPSPPVDLSSINLASHTDDHSAGLALYNEGRHNAKTIAHLPAGSSSGPESNNSGGEAIEDQPIQDGASNCHPVEPQNASPLKHAWHGLVTVLRLLEKSADAFPPLKSAIGGLVACIELTETVKENHQEYISLLNDLKALVEQIEPHIPKLLEGDRSSSFARIVMSIDEEIDHIRILQDRKLSIRIIEAQQDKDGIVAHYRRIFNLFQCIQCNVNLRTWDATMKLWQAFLLECLSPVDDARYNSSYSTTLKRRACTAETRKKLLQALLEWVRDPKGAKVYWMNGMAGTGKTTIMYSLCEILVAEHHLGANYFCSSVSVQCRAANTIVPTLAYQLAQYSSPFRSELCKALEQEPEASKLHIPSQFEKLIQKPLSLVKEAFPKNVVIFIDALDECEDSSTMEIFLKELLRIAESLPVKFLITSRPEPGIRTAMHLSAYSSSLLRLHDIEEAVVKADIELFLQDALRAMSPSSTQVTQLADKAGKLFIFAATAVRYISPDDPRVDSDDRLRRVMKSASATTKQHKEIDKLYRSILLAACDNERLEEDEILVIHLVLKTVVCAREPMSVPTLASICGCSVGQVRRALEPLHSVLHVRQDAQGLVAPFHLSFPDFIFDEHRSREFSCDKKVQNVDLAEWCFNIMRIQLRFNICDLESSFVFDKDVPDLEHRVKNSITTSLLYACRFWADHLVESEPSAALQTIIGAFLSHQLLFWMEVLNVTGCISIAGRSLKRAYHWFGHTELFDETRRQLADAEEFVTRFTGVCKRSTPHIYISLFSFCRRDSSVYQNYRHKMQGLIEVKGSILETQLSGDIGVWQMGSSVKSIAFSPDGERVACGLENGSVCLLDAHSGDAIFESFHDRRPSTAVGGPSVVFSQDGRCIVGWEAHTIRILDSIDGSSVATFEVQGLSAVAFSADSSKIVTGSSNGEIQLWDTHHGGKVGASFGINSSGISVIASSPDGSHIFAGLRDGTIRVWVASNCTLASHQIMRHHGSVDNITFLQNGSLIASIVNALYFRMWDASNGELITDRHTGQGMRDVTFSRDGTLYAGKDYLEISVYDTLTRSRVAGPFKGHTSSINTLAFSPDGRRVLSGSCDNTIRTWVTNSNQTFSSIPSRFPMIESVAFFPDGRQIVQSGGSLLRVWDTVSGEIVGGMFGGHEGYILSVAVSPDGHVIATGSLDKTVRLWVAETGLAHSEPLRHSDCVNSVTFSLDGRNVISGSNDMTVRVWALDGGDEVARLEHDGCCVKSVAISPDGTRIASGTAGVLGSTGRIYVWDVMTHQTAFKPLIAMSWAVQSLVFSPCGTRLVSQSTIKTFQVWDTSNGDPIVVPFEGRTNGNQSFAFSPDGMYIASGSDNNTIRIWDSFSGNLVAKLRGHADWIHSIAFSPDGHHLFSGSRDQTSRVWNLIKVFSSASSRPHRGEADHNFLDGAQITIEDDGWVYADRIPFFWYPPSFSTYLPYPFLNSIILSSHGAISAEYHNLAIGKKWIDCNRSL